MPFPLIIGNISPNVSIIVIVSVYVNSDISFTLLTLQELGLDVLAPLQDEMVYCVVFRRFNIASRSKCMSYLFTRNRFGYMWLIVS